MSAPGNAPAGCPRRRDGGIGPRKCELVECRYHLRPIGTRGPASPRLRLALFAEDTCTCDVRDRSKAHGIELTYREIGILLGASKQAVHQLAKSGLQKLRRAFRIK